MIDIHWFTLVGVVIGAFGFGIGTGFMIDRKRTENFAKRVAAAEASIAEIREARIASKDRNTDDIKERENSND